MNFSLQAPSHVPAAADFTEKMLSSAERAKAYLEKAQKAYADQGRCEVTCKVGEQVLLNTRNVGDRSPGCPKLLPRWNGPYKVFERFGKVVYRLELPIELKTHPVLHVATLEYERPCAASSPQDAHGWASVLDNWQNSEPLVWQAQIFEFLVGWEGYDPSHYSWETEANILDPHIVEGYWDYVASCEQHTNQQAKQTVSLCAILLHICQQSNKAL